MPVEVIMPKVDMDMDKGKLSVWHVSEGAEIEKGAALFDIETDKAAMEVEAPATGTLHHISAAAGVDVPVGQAVAWIYAAGEEVGAPPVLPSTASEPRPPAPPAETATTRPDQVTPPPAGKHRATPAARRLARGAGLDLGAIAGTGPNTRVQAADVERHLAQRQATAPAPAAIPEIAAPAHWDSQPGALHVSRTEGTGAPLVMLHGFGADSFGWRPLEDALRSKHPLIRIDLPGHGRSPRRRIDSFATLARQITEAFDALHLEEPVHLLGHSLGGALALALADIRPRNLRSLSLIAPAGLGPEIDGDTLLGIARASRAESLAPWLKRLTATPDGISWDFAKAAMMTREDPALRHAQRDLAAVLFPDGTQAFDLSAALDRVSVPTTMIWGRCDHIMPWQHALKAKGSVALHFLHKAGHIPQVECPSDVAGILKRHMVASG